VGARRFAASWLLAMVLGTAPLVGITPAAAQPVIPPGQEARVLELLAPHGFGSPPVDGWRLDAVSIERSFIQVTVIGDEGSATLRLHHPDAFEGAERTPSFAVERSGASERALDPWVEAVRENDGGDFWDAMPVRVDRASGAAQALDALAVAATGGALALVLALGFWERRRFGPDPPRTVLVIESSLRARLLLSVGLTAVAVVALWLTARAPPLHPDTNRDLLLARDCLESGLCLGPSTSFGGLQQHGGWTRLLAALRGLGLEPAGVHRVLIGLDAAGAGVLAFVASRRLPLVLAFAGSVVAFSWLVWAASFPILWNPSLSPLAHALLFAGALERRWWAAGVLGGLGVVGAVETHLAGLVALAVVVLALRALAERPGRAVALALLVFAGLELTLSAPAIEMNLASVSARRIVLPAIVVGLGLSWLVGGLLRRRLGPGRRTLAVLALCALGTTGPPLLAALAAGHFLTARYFVSAIVPAVGLGAAALEWLWSREARPARWAAPLLALAALALSAKPWADAADRHYYDLAEVAAIADALEVADGYARVRLSLRGPMTGLLGEGLAAWAEDARFDPPADAPTLRVVRVEDLRSLPEAWRVVPLASGAFVGVSELRSWLRPERAEVCLTTEGPPACLTLTPAMWRSFGGERGDYERFASGLLPAAEALRERTGADRPTLFVRIPIATGGRDAERLLQLFDDVGGEGGWRVARVEGVGHRGELGSQRVVLLRGGEGTLTLEYTAPVAHYVPSLVLDALELRPEERELRDVVCADFFGCD